LPANADAAKIFYIVRYQLIMSSGGPVDIIHSAIRDAMRDYRIDDRRKCFEKVTMLARRWWIPKLNEKKEA
jgi:hypothetical protein